MPALRSMNVRRMLVLSFAGVALLAGLTFGYNRYSTAKIRARAIGELTAIGAETAGDVQDRLGHVTSDALGIQHSPYFAEAAAGLVAAPDSQALRSAMEARLGAEADSAVLQSVSFVAPDTTVLAAYGGSAEDICDSVDESLVRSLSGADTPVIIDHCDAENQTPHWDVYVPIRPPDGDGLLGVVYESLGTDGEGSSCFRTWSGSFKTGEALLVRWDGENLWTTHRPRLSESSGPAMITLTDEWNPPVGEADPTPVSVRALDYRGKEVLAEMLPLAGTDYWVLTKVDAEEVAAVAAGETGVVGAIAAAMIALSLGVTYSVFDRETGHVRRSLKDAEEVRDELEQHVDLLTRHANDAVLVLDGQLRILFSNASAVEMYGFDATPDEKRWLSSVVPERAWSEEKQILDSIEPGEGRVYETLHRAGDKEFAVECSTHCVEIGRRRRYQIFVRDISARMAAQRELEARDERLRGLATELVQTEERERRLIAASLHDNVGQSLALLNMRLDMLSSKAKCDKESIAILQDTQSIVQRAIRDTRSLTYELSPPILHELGLVAAIGWLIEQFEYRHPLTFDLTDDGADKPLDANVKTALFAAVRELLTNVVKHAHAARVGVDISKVGETIRIEVRDDGSGFDVAHSEASHAGRMSFGLFSVKERLGYLGGSVEIESAVGQGSTVTLIAPLQTDSDD